MADFGVGMAAALVAKYLAEAGASVQRMEPDGGDPCCDIYPAYAGWRAVLGGCAAYSPALEQRLVGQSDIVIIGGEQFATSAHGQDPRAWLTANPRLIILDITQSLTDDGFNALHCADILMQARAGLVFEAYPDRPALLGFTPSATGAALQALVAIGAALYQRQVNGCGQIVAVGLLEGAMTWPLAFWGRAEKPTPRYTLRAPRGARALIFRTRDGADVQIVMGSAGAKYRLYQLLGIDDDTITSDDAGLPNPGDGPDKYFGDVDRLAPHVALRECDELLAALATAGVVAERICPPGANWDEPQTIHNNIIMTLPDGASQVGQPVNWRFCAGNRATVSLPAMTAPLNGIRVLDFGAFVAGPMLSVVLGDLGADVIKVEPPRGDPLRSIYRFYRAANRGKRAIAIEMKDEAGLKLAHQLAESADIVCSNFRFGVSERLGIDADQLMARQPDKIVVVNAGYGVVGPKKSQPAFDPCIQAACGHEMRAGGLTNLPLLNPMMMTDLCGGMLGAIGALFALYRRALDGCGAAVTVPLLNAGLFLLSDIIRAPDGAMRGPLALLPDQTGYHATEKLYQTSDGWIAIAARDDRSARALARVFTVLSAVGKQRREWGDAEMRDLASALGRHSTRSALAVLADADIPAEACRHNVDEAFLSDDRNVAAGFVYETTAPELGKVRGLGRLFRMQGGMPLPRGDVSEQGEDTHAILTELRLSAPHIAALISGRAVTFGKPTNIGTA